MTGPELKQLRHDLSDAVGRRLSVADMAKMCGLNDPERNGKDTMRKWEDGPGPSGPVAALLSVLGYASDGRDIPQEILSKGADIIAPMVSENPSTVAEAAFREMMLAEVMRRLS